MTDVDLVNRDPNRLNIHLQVINRSNVLKTAFVDIFQNYL